MNFGIAFTVAGSQETINVINFTIDQVANFALMIANNISTVPNSVIVTIPS